MSFDFNHVHNKRAERAQQILKSYHEEDSTDSLEKGGAGSKGGKIIGYTKSGKPIYDSTNHSAHKNFTKEDHIDAANAHLHGNYDLSKKDSLGRFNDPKYLEAKGKHDEHMKEKRKLERKEKYDSLKDDNEESRTKTFEKLVKKRRADDSNEEHHDNLHDHIAANHGEEAAHHFSETFDPTSHTMKHAKQILENAKSNKSKEGRK